MHSCRYEFPSSRCADCGEWAPAVAIPEGPRDENWSTNGHYTVRYHDRGNTRAAADMGVPLPTQWPSKPNETEDAVVEFIDALHALGLKV